MIDNLTEAIAHYEERARYYIETLKPFGDKPMLEATKKYIARQQEFARKYEQLAAWLTELQERREADRWIPVSERLPDDLEPVNITWINHEPASYYEDIKDKPFTATGVYFNGQWYWWSTLCTDTLAEYSHNYDDIVDTAIEITHWRPLPKPESEAGE